MERLTKRIDLGNGKYTVDFSNERCGEFLTDHKAGVRHYLKGLQPTKMQKNRDC